MIELAEIVADWPLAATMATVAAAQGLRAGRRRESLNEALHELRRPLQAIALAGPGGGDSPPVLESSVSLAAAALDRLDREVNGRSLLRPKEAIELRPLLEAAVRRWKARASLGGGSLELRWRAGSAIVAGDRVGLSQALDNLIVNAIEHGGPTIVVAASRCEGRLRIAVVDSGRAWRLSSRRGGPAEVLARLGGRRRHGHGLAVVRGIASAHGGRFGLRPSAQGTLAVIELPLSEIDEEQVT